MVQAIVGVETLTDDAVILDDNSAHHRTRTRESCTHFREFEGSPNVLKIVHRERIWPRITRLYDSCREQGFHEIVGGEFNEVVEFFADADEANGNLQVFGDSRDDATLRGPIEFRQDQSGNTGAPGELAGLLEP